MSSADDMTLWVKKLSDGNPAAAQAIWDKYFQRMADFARQKLNRLPQRVADEEDVALSAMHSFCRGAAAGRFPQLADRHDLWLLLVTITARKVYAQMRRQRAVKRGQGKVRGESVFLKHSDADQEQAGIEQILGHEPTPELANMMAENCEMLLSSLDDDSLRDIALLKLEGYTNEEIAAKLNCVSRTVERKLERIRDKWSKERLP
jgi:DNA-directed RNA polymerase specialized sigma24 family protein